MVTLRDEAKLPLKAIAYKYSIPPTISSRVYSLFHSNEVHNICALFPIPYSLFPKHSAITKCLIAYLKKRGSRNGSPLTIPIFRSKL
ncbi:MAG: hypothetical protein F6K55_37725 [Moorea sp. SIO4A3]|nr:hypothetical protein [Moorena sp. SIO4A3]